jgi:hypothetical protein
MYQNMQLFPEQLSFMKGHMHALASVNFMLAIIRSPDIYQQQTLWHQTCT